MFVRWLFPLVLLILVSTLCYSSPSDPVLYAKAVAGDADAQYSLGLEYTTGKLGKPDGAEALKWLTKAAEQGHARAQLYLSALYVNGDTPGIPQNWSTAYLWIKLAEKTHATYPSLPGRLISDLLPDDFGIPKRLAQIESHLSKEDMAAVQKRVDKWQLGQPIP
jgi:hypothetical protein